MSNISPGVYTKIIDLSTFVQEVPSSTGFIVALTPKGRDNQLVFLGSRSELILEFGEPNIAQYTKDYSQGPYMAHNFLGESGSLYFMRVLPDDASFSTLVLDTSMDAAASAPTISITSIDSTAANTLADLKSALIQVGETKPLCVLYPIGRGEYYNSLSVKLTTYSNPIAEGIYIIDIYEKQSDGSEAVIESFDISFDPTAVDSAGESLFITDVLKKFSTVLRAEMTLASGAYSTGYELVVKSFDKNIGVVTVTKTESLASIKDLKQNFSDWQKASETGLANYAIIAMDSRGVKLYGWLGASAGDGNDEVAVFNGRNFDSTSTIQSWIEPNVGDLALFDTAGVVTYKIKKSFLDISTAFTLDSPLKNGSDGSLLLEGGNIDPTVATQLLAQGYSDSIDDNVMDTENMYFNLVFDCGYPTAVKDAIVTMTDVRRDCLSIIDNGDNASFMDSMSARQELHPYNTYLTAIHEPYNKIYDPFTGREIWVSPVYHMSYLLPRNDKVGEQWYAAAGFTRGIIQTIKEMRFNAKIGNRDQMYLKQLNPIVKFNPGYTVWSQLTSQSKPSAMQDINIVRLVLYVKRALEEYCKYFIFEQNDAFTWSQVQNNIQGFLESVKSRRGLYGYSIDVAATEYEIKKKTFHVNVTLNPTRVVEKIELNFFIK